MQIIPNGDTKPIPFLMVLSSDHVTPATGLSPTVVISKNGGSFASPSGSIAEIGNGWYDLTPGGSDTTTNGMLLLSATAATADPSNVASQVQEIGIYTPPGASGGLLIAGTNSDFTLASLTVTGNTTYAGPVSMESGLSITTNANGYPHALTITAYGQGVGLWIQGDQREAVNILTGADADVGNGWTAVSIIGGNAIVDGQQGGDGIDLIGGSPMGDNAAGSGLFIGAGTSNGQSAGAASLWIESIDLASAGPAPGSVAGVYTAGFNNGSGLQAVGNGSGDGMRLAGGTTGNASVAV